MLQDKYVFNNRYGDLVQLIKQDENLYLLDGNLDYMRIGYAGDDKTKLDFADPSGGPFLQVGAKWFDFEIEKIDNICSIILFTLKENGLSN